MNDKSCLVDAAAHTLCLRTFANPDFAPGVYEKEYEAARSCLVDQIGHDASERHFHSQEIQDALRVHNILMIRHELYPCLQTPPPPGEVRVKVIPIYSREDAPEIFVRKLRNHGILVVRKSNGVHHAMSFQAGNNVAYDVQKKEFTPLEDLDIVMYLEFIPYENNPTQ